MFSAPMISFFIISIHAPARGATRYARFSIKRARNFNPRSREGSDVNNIVSLCNKFISIHAPARGATKVYADGCKIRKISIHAPARGATRSDQCCTGKNEFQSTLPRGERLCLCCYLCHVISISIHAPARGATAEIVALMIETEISIHAPARGATSLIFTIM